MIVEEAYYFQLLLSAGFDDGYETWLDGYLEAEDPLSEIVLNLAVCGPDVNRTISCLQQFCYGREIDERLVCEKLRMFLKQAYHIGRMDKKAVVSAMHRITSVHGDPGDFAFDLWADMYYLDHYYTLAEDGIIPREQFDAAFIQFLDDKIPLDGTMWYTGAKRRESLIGKIKKIFKK